MSLYPICDIIKHDLSWSLLRRCTINPLTTALIASPKSRNFRISEHLIERFLEQMLSVCPLTS